MTLFTEQEKCVLGLTTEHLVSYEEAGCTFFLEPETLTAFKKLRQTSIDAGFNLSLVSAFRSFERQKQIWNGKFEGSRKVHDDQGHTLDLRQMTVAEKVAAIIRFSAVPGLSRHHLGTDMDVFDASVMQKNAVQLEPYEVEVGGICAPMHEWLDERIEKGEAFGFYRPFETGSKTVASERWHLSYQCKASELTPYLSTRLLEKVWQEKPLMAKDYLIEHVEELLQFFGET